MLLILINVLHGESSWSKNEEEVWSRRLKLLSIWDRTMERKNLLRPYTHLCYQVLSKNYSITGRTRISISMTWSKNVLYRGKLSRWTWGANQIGNPDWKMLADSAGLSIFIFPVACERDRDFRPASLRLLVNHNPWLGISTNMSKPPQAPPRIWQHYWCLKPLNDILALP